MVKGQKAKKTEGKQDGQAGKTENKSRRKMCIEENEKRGRETGN